MAFWSPIAVRTGMVSDVKKIAVIGAGASGMFAATCAAEQGCKVDVYEHTEQAGKKILMTGNGKCNLTNLHMGSDCYYHDSDDQNILEKLLSEFSPADTIKWFERHGLLIRKRDTYVYPYCEQASAVRDVLYRSMIQSGVKLQCAYDCYHELEQLPDGGFRIGGKKYDCLILACGGKSARNTGSDGSGYEIAKKMGHHIITPRAALVQLHTDLPQFKLLGGLRVQGSVTYHGYTQKGEIQFTEYGISGIAVFQLSRIAVKDGFAQRKEAILDLYPDYSLEELTEIIADRISQSTNTDYEQALTGILHTKLIAYALKVLSLKDRSSAAGQIALLVKQMRIPITGSHKLDCAQVTQGGIPLYEVKEHLESVYVKGLYFTGEILDVDGICGGYNLQWAWSSGYAAAMECARDK